MKTTKTSRLSYTDCICLRAELLSAASFNIQFDESKKQGHKLLVVGANAWDTAKQAVYQTVLGVTSLTGGEVVTHERTPRVINVSPGESRTYAHAICETLKAANLLTVLTNVLLFLFLVGDSCAVNTGVHNGVAAVIADWLLILVIFVDCYCHILHNSLETGITKGWDADPTKKRQGANSKQTFFLEKVMTVGCHPTTHANPPEHAIELLPLLHRFLIQCEAIGAC